MNDLSKISCSRNDFLHINPVSKESSPGDRPELPDTLEDYLTGEKIPFSNRDNIRQKVLRFLVEKKGYGKDDIFVDRVVTYRIEGQTFRSLVDVSLVLDGRTLMVWKCASGSLVSRERQIIAAARLLEHYVVPLGAVTNGEDVELLDTSNGKVLNCGFESLPSREELTTRFAHAVLQPLPLRKIVNEQRILYTYDAISCPVVCKEDPLS